MKLSLYNMPLYASYVLVTLILSQANLPPDPTALLSSPMATAPIVVNPLFTLAIVADGPWKQ